MTDTDIDFEYPTVTCPECGAEQEDFDGFGFVYCGHCGHCTHPSKIRDDRSGCWACELCGFHDLDDREVMTA
ncbi:hypothetical protein VSS37_09610 [Candidatus Thiothrix sp. Deng01]|uniref:Uncharacterized protein n=1 Tax=Candidatus Thiothrix phosphatis TaxID=3112415 RepID=A0ABU6CYS9_9GAMM|nr:hypothetical protein [Candidatus Thiothrix sp. Deng01]MEB4591232.1 hypothetical protein [Candidatus Thiothrix sp. Deng01]